MHEVHSQTNIQHKCIFTGIKNEWFQRFVLFPNVALIGSAEKPEYRSLNIKPTLKIFERGTFMLNEDREQ